MKFRTIVMAIILPVSVIHAATAALAPDKSRYVFKGDKPALSATINNESNKTYGGQLWIENLDKSDTKPAFVATPSFFKIEGKGLQVFRFLKVADDLPQDRESVYWLNIQEIPPAKKGSGLSLAIRTRLKLFYRPESILEGRNKAEELLTIEHLPGEKWLVNNTPYIFTIGSLLDENNSIIKLDKSASDNLLMFKTGDKIDITGKTVAAVSALNDYGNTQSYYLKK